MRDYRPAPADQLDLLVGEVDAVRENGFFAEQSERIEVDDRRHPAMGGAALFDFAGGLRRVDVDPPPVRGGGDFAEQRLRHRVDRVWCVSDGDPLRQGRSKFQQFGIGTAVAFEQPAVGPGDVEQPDGGAHAHFDGGADRLLLMPVHIREEHGTGPDHFEDGQPGAVVDVLRREPGFRGPDVVVEPGEELHVVGVAAQQRHGRVGVDVEEGWHCGQAAAAVEHPVRRVCDAGGDLKDAVSFNQNVAVFAFEQDVFEQKSGIHDSAHRLQTVKLRSDFARFSDGAENLLLLLRHRQVESGGQVAGQKL